MYTMYSDLIDCNVGDIVYVYNGKRIKKINKDMLGEIEFVEQETHEDWDGMQYLKYKVVIKASSGERITIKDNGIRPFFRKYEFITLKDLKDKYNIEIE